MPRSRALAPAHAVVSLLTLVLCACSIDTRKLHAAQAEGGTAPAQPGEVEAGAGGSEPAGTAGKSSQLVDGCADLDTDGVADCKATLVTNANFATNVEDWTPDIDAQLSWDSKNALDDLPSGSAKLKAITARPSASQCVALPGKQLVIAYANAFVAGETQLGQAELEVSFFESEDCSGERAGYFETPPSTIANAWTTVQAGGVAVTGTNSVSLALVGLEPQGAAELDFYFDNVMLKTKPL